MGVDRRRRRKRRGEKERLATFWVGMKLLAENLARISDLSILIASSKETERNRRKKEGKILTCYLPDTYLMRKGEGKVCKWDEEEKEEEEEEEEEGGGRIVKSDFWRLERNY